MLVCLGKPRVARGVASMLLPKKCCYFCLCGGYSGLYDNIIKDIQDGPVNEARNDLKSIMRCQQIFSTDNE